MNLFVEPKIVHWVCKSVYNFSRNHHFFMRLARNEIPYYMGTRSTVRVQTIHFSTKEFFSARSLPKFLFFFCIFHFRPRKTCNYIFFTCLKQLIYVIAYYFHTKKWLWNIFYTQNLRFENLISYKQFYFHCTSVLIKLICNYLFSLILK